MKLRLTSGTVSRRRGMAASLVNLVPLTLEAGDLIRAKGQLIECLRLIQQLGSKYIGTWALEAAGLCVVAEAGSVSNPLLVQEHLRTAARLYGAAKALREAIGSPLRQKDLDAQLEQLVALRMTLGEEALNAALDDGNEMSFASSISYALEWLEGQDGGECAGPPPSSGRSVA